MSSSKYVAENNHGISRRGIVTIVGLGLTCFALGASPIASATWHQDAGIIGNHIHSGNLDTSIDSITRYEYQPHNMSSISNPIDSANQKPLGERVSAYSQNMWLVDVTVINDGDNMEAEFSPVVLLNGSEYPDGPHTPEEIANNNVVSNSSVSMFDSIDKNNGEDVNRVFNSLSNNTMATDPKYRSDVSMAYKGSPDSSINITQNKTITVPKGESHYTIAIYYYVQDANSKITPYMDTPIRNFYDVNVELRQVRG